MSPSDVRPVAFPSASTSAGLTGPPRASGGRTPAGTGAPAPAPDRLARTGRREPPHAPRDGHGRNRRQAMSRVRSASRRLVVVAAALLVVGLTPNIAAAHPSEPARGDPGVVLAWNAIAWRTIGVEGMKP